MLYYEAGVCNYRFEDGKVCFDERTLNPSINCPLCGGTGVIYKPPKEIVGIIIDSPDTPQRKREGVILTDTFRLVVPPEVPVKLLQVTSNGRIFFVRDKFDIYSSNGTLWTTVYVDSEPKDVWLSGMLYKSFKVATHYLSVRKALGKEEFNLEDKKYVEPIVSKYNIDTNEDKEIENILKNLLIETR